MTRTYVAMRWRGCLGSCRGRLRSLCGFLLTYGCPVYCTRKRWSSAGPTHPASSPLAASNALSAWRTSALSSLTAVPSPRAPAVAPDLNSLHRAVPPQRPQHNAQAGPGGSARSWRAPIRGFTVLRNHSIAAAPGSHTDGLHCQGGTCQGLQHVRSKCSVCAPRWALRRLSSPLLSKHCRELRGLCRRDCTVRSHPRARCPKVGAVNARARISGRCARRAGQPLPRVCAP